MDAIPKSKMGVRGPGNVDPLWIGELIRIAISGTVRHPDEGSRRNGNAREINIDSRHAAANLVRAVVTQQFLYRLLG